MNRHKPVVSQEGLGTILLLGGLAGVLIAALNKSSKGNGGNNTTKLQTPYVTTVNNLKSLVERLTEEVSLADKVSVDVSLLGNGAISPKNHLIAVQTFVATIKKKVVKHFLEIEKIDKELESSSNEWEYYREKYDEQARLIAKALSSYNGRITNGLEIAINGDNFLCMFDKPRTNIRTIDVMSPKDIADSLTVATKLMEEITVLNRELRYSKSAPDQTVIGFELGEMILETVKDFVVYLKAAIE